MELLTDLFKAYYDARRNKRNTHSQLCFEMGFEKNLLELYYEIRDRSYRVGKSVCFIVNKPVKREIFAAGFRDRVVHHLLYNYIAPIVEKKLIDDSYSCRKGKGTLKGVKQLEHHIRSCSDNYRQRAYVLKMDIEGYFMSINRELLFQKICRMLKKHFKRNGSKECVNQNSFDMDLIMYLLKEIIFNDPTSNCYIKGDLSDWEGLPHSKSLFYSKKGVGLPIGNLTSQLFSNVFLNELDRYVKRNMGLKYYGRYVDDFYIVHADKERLIEYRDCIKLYLDEKLGLTLHPKKMYLQEVCKGLSFLGVTIKPYRCYVNSKTRKKVIKYFSEIEKSLKDHDCLLKNEFQHIQSSVNSYLGYLHKFKTYKMRKSICDRSPNLDRLYNQFGFKLNSFP